MSVAKSGFKLREFKAGDPRPTPPQGTNFIFTETMSSFADAVSSAADRPVLDKTGLTGMYIFEFQIEPGGDILTAAQSVGLKFEAQKAPIETIIVDRIEKPSEN